MVPGKLQKMKQQRVLRQDQYVSLLVRDHWWERVETQEFVSH
jgi:hypothetical protein